MLPTKIAEIHEIMAKAKHGENVDKCEILHILKDIIRDEANFGIWIKREVGNNENYISFIVVGRNSSGEKRVVGYRVEIR